MSEKLQQRIWMMANNTIRIMGFIFLSVVFNKWWIVLLACLFLVSETDK